MSTSLRPGYGAPGQVGERRGRRLTGVGAVLLLIAASFVGGCIDVLTGAGLRFAFAVGLVLGSVIAAVLVRRRDLMMVVFAPPLVYLAASLLSLLAAPGGGLGNTAALIDAATGWLVYGFPAIATATGAAIVVAGLRMLGGHRRY